MSSTPPKLPLRHGPRLRREQITQRIRRIVAAIPVVIHVHLEHVFGPVRIVLQRRQRLNQPSAPASTGTFTNLPDATSPYTDPITAAQ